LVAEKLPKEEVQHFVEQGGCAPGLRIGARDPGGPEWRAQDNGISRERVGGTRVCTRLHEGNGGAAIGRGRTKDVRHAGSKSVGYRAKAKSNQVRGGLVVRPWDWPRWIPEKETEQAQGLPVACLEFSGGILGQPYRVSNRSADDVAALVRYERRASGGTMEPKSRRGRNRGLGESKILPKMQV
jgi:hypothetical protein